jgi:hypothetical protein
VRLSGAGLGPGTPEISKIQTTGCWTALAEDRCVVAPAGDRRRGWHSHNSSGHQGESDQGSNELRHGIHSLKRASLPL